MSRIVQHPATTIEEAHAAALEWVARMRAIGHAGDADKLHAEIKAILSTDAVRKRLLDAGTETEYLGPTEFGAFYVREMDQWASVIRKANIALKE